MCVVCACCSINVKEVMWLPHDITTTSRTPPDAEWVNELGPYVQLPHIRRIACLNQERSASSPAVCCCRIRRHHWEGKAGASASAARFLLTQLRLAAPVMTRTVILRRGVILWFSYHAGARLETGRGIRVFLCSM